MLEGFGENPEFWWRSDRSDSFFCFLLSFGKLGAKVSVTGRCPRPIVCQILGDPSNLPGLGFRGLDTATIEDAWSSFFLRILQEVHAKIDQTAAGTFPCRLVTASGAELAAKPCSNAAALAFTAFASSWFYGVLLYARTLHLVWNSQKKIAAPNLLVKYGQIASG